jgi:proton-translocating NADH-quinone oxidoreductase chain L
MAEVEHGASAFEFTQLHGGDVWTALLIIGLPIIASALIFFFGKKMWRGGAMISIIAVLGSLGLSLKWFIAMLGGAGPSGWTIDWFTIGEYTFTVGVLMDNLSIWMATLVSFLSLLIVIFSTKYMSDETDGKLRRYYAVKVLFISGMLGTVLMDNYLLMFIFWEIMGLCSYLLIGFWFHKESAAIAAKKAFLVTRLGDILLMVGLFVLLITFKTLSYREIFNDPNLSDHAGSLMAAGLLIFGGAVGKSAQFPLDIWLPDAMEGPTTVSALIHAATMVKAGVYLVARSFPILLENPEIFVVIGVIGGITAIYTASMALVALDIKRVLAFSTLSQLGYMFLALGAGGIVYVETQNGVGFTAAMLHLMNHAFFKALLFLGSASVIMGMHHHQDMRDMGGLRKKMPITWFTMLIGSLSIAGMIPLSGFWSKDEVLATAFKAGEYNMAFTVLWVMGLITALMTAFYMFRMMFLTFGDKPRTEHAEHAHESSKVMTMPLMILAIFAAVSGLWLVTGLGGGFESVITYPYTAELGEAHHVEPSEILSQILGNPLTYLSLAIGASGILIAWLVYRNGLPAKEAVEPTTGLRGLLYNRYYVTQVIYEPLGNIFAIGIAKLSSIFDKKCIDGAVDGIASLADTGGQNARRWQNGNVATYTSSIAIGVIVLLGLAILLGAL